MPINWGIESYKWQSITNQIESISYFKSVQSVFAGICLGNIAPGRAIEFLGKIVFFKSENRPTITVLHFINGFFQMLITVSAGLVAIIYKLTNSNASSYLMYVVLFFCTGLILFFCWAIVNVAYVQKKLSYFKWFKLGNSSHDIKLSKKLMIKLIGFSIIRYTVFATQFYLIYSAMLPQVNFTNAITSIAAYFMITSAVPMISVIEPAIRAAIALFVFNNGADNTAIVILSSTSLWLINVVIPSAIGYIIVLKEKIEFKTS